MKQFVTAFIVILLFGLLFMIAYPLYLSYQASNIKVESPQIERIVAPKNQNGEQFNYEE